MCNSLGYPGIEGVTYKYTILEEGPTLADSVLSGGRDWTFHPNNNLNIESIDKLFHNLDLSAYLLLLIEKLIFEA